LGHGERLDVAVVDSETRGMVDHLNGNRFDSGGRGIALGIAAELARYSEVGGAFGIVAGVRGPHARHGLRHRTKGSFHCGSSDAATAGSNLARAIAVGEDLK
jgi:hypothetical protein